MASIGVEELEREVESLKQELSLWKERYQVAHEERLALEAQLMAQSGAGAEVSLFLLLPFSLLTSQPPPLLLGPKRQ